jgi:Cu(I)/Ag(I) efflux system protein CusF
MNLQADFTRATSRVLMLCAAIASPTWAANPPGGQGLQADQGKPATAASSEAGASEMVPGEVRRVDKDAKRLTIRHGEIKHLDMPAMTMVFQVKEAGLLDQVKAGDRIRFAVEKANSAYVVTAIQRDQ